MKQQKEQNLVAHINVLDSNNEVYCHLTGGKLSFNDLKKVRHQCSHCKFFGGTAQGQGVECVYNDPDAEFPVVYNK